MSATIRKEDFLESSLFPRIRHLHIASNALNYTLHYNKATPNNYLLEAKKKVLQIHRLLPPGTVLVFLSGKDELFKLRSLLAPHCNPTSYPHATLSTDELKDEDEIFNLSDDETFNRSEDQTFNRFEDETFNQSEDQLELLLEGEKAVITKADKAVPPIQDDLLPTEDEDELLEEEGEDGREIELNVLTENYKKTPTCKWLGADGSGALTVKILHASQTSREQMNCFMLPTDGERVVILSTNVAETSITLPNIRYVVDSGVEKRKVFDNARELERFELCRISKSSAGQRAGRCGRVGHGHCYRLYTNSLYEHFFPDYSPVQILNSNLSSLVLFLLTMGIDPYRFRWLTDPPRGHVTNALTTLYVLGIVHLKLKSGPGRGGNDLEDLSMDPFGQRQDPLLTNQPLEDELELVNVTKLGRCVALIPLEPRYAKMVYCLLARYYSPNTRTTLGMDDPTNFISVSLIIITLLSFNGPIFLPQETNSEKGPQQPEEKESDRREWLDDLEMLNQLVANFSNNSGSNSTKSSSNLTKSSSNSANSGSILWRQRPVNRRAMREVFKQAKQVQQIVNQNFDQLSIPFKGSELTPLKKEQLNELRQSILPCLVDRIAVNLQTFDPQEKRRGYVCHRVRDRIVHLRDEGRKVRPELVAYNHLIGEEKLRMEQTLLVTNTCLSHLKSPLVTTQVEGDPEYNSSDGSIAGLVRVYYQPIDYLLSVRKIKLGPELQLTYRSFGYFFSHGLIFEQLKRFSHHLLYDKGDFYRPMTVNSPIGRFVKALIRGRVCDKGTFMARYTLDRNYLLEEYRGLLSPETDFRTLADSYNLLE